MVNQNNIKKTNEKVKVGNRNAVLYIGQRGGKYIKVKGEYVKYNKKIQNGKGFNESQVPTLKSLAKNTLKKEISKELLYTDPTPERKEELDEITELMKRMDTPKEINARRIGLENKSAREIQTKWRSIHPLIKINVITPVVSAAIPAVTEYIINDKSFRLYVSNFNYFEYLKPDNVESITDEGNNIIKIELNRNKIGHSERRFLLVDLNNRTLTWHNIHPDINRTEFNLIRLLTPDKIRLILPPY